MKLLGNLGGEEPQPPDPLPPEAAKAAALWSWLFGRGASLLGGAVLAWPPAIGPAPEEAIFDFLKNASGWAWINTEAACERLRAEGVSQVGGADPPTVLATHDKAFAIRTAREENLDADEFLDAVCILDEADLEEPDAAADVLRAHFHPASGERAPRVVLKPRLGTTGRGQRTMAVASFGEELAPALTGLRGRGGVVVEPALDRIADFSVQFAVEADGSLRLLGSLRQDVSARGAFLGHRGEIDSRGRVRTGEAWEEELREAASCVASSAARAGYRGPCGVDALSYRAADGQEKLRAVVEFNARFTMGIVATGLLRGALRGLREELRFSPGELRRFQFRPRGDAHDSVDGIALGDGAFLSIER